MTRNNFTLDGQSTTSFGVGISGYQVYNSSERDVESFHVPHRNGDLISDNKCFTNRRIVYNCWIAHNFKEKIDDFRDFLMAHSDRYYKLEDTYHPTHVYEARIVGSIEPQAKVMMRCGEFDIVFDAKPQRYRRDGLVWTTDGIIENPTRHSCYPVIEVRGTGQIVVNDQTITVNAGAKFPFLIDCETMECMTEAKESQNAFVEMPLDNISLKAGSNLVSGNIRIQPRWYDL